MKPNIENALWQCGRERVMHREFGGKPGIAIRWDATEPRITNPDGTQSYLVREGETLDEAGAAAAEAFAKRVEEVGKALIEQARRIRSALVTP